MEEDVVGAGEEPCGSRTILPDIVQSTLLEKLESAGGKIQKNYCTSPRGSNRTFMFPPAPNLSKFIDAFQRKSNELSNKEKNEKEKHDDYEAEVEVFRALERIKNIIVLHELKYTHEQYEEFVPLHSKCKCKKKAQDEEGECDFVVIGDNFILVLEVKSPDMNSKNLEKLYKASLAQRRRTVELIKGIFEQTSTKLPTILDFSVFNRQTKEDLVRFNKYSSERKNIVLKEDMTDFKIWWSENVQNVPVSSFSLIMQGVFKRPIDILLGLWCADKENICTIENCGLAKCIRDVDNELRTGTITRKPEAPINRDIKGAPKIFKDHLKIKCITNEQKDIFWNKSNFLWINGSAGSGKTVLLLGKIIDLVIEGRVDAEKKRKIMLLAFGADDLERYKKALNNAEIKTFSFCLRGSKSETVSPIPSNKLLEELKEALSNQKSYEIVIVYFDFGASLKFLEGYRQLFTMFSDHHVFIDDAQCMFSYHAYNVIVTDDGVKELLNMLQKERDPNCICWASFDIVQLLYYRMDLHLQFGVDQNTINLNVIDHLKGFVVDLSVNLRNTVEIIDLLEVLQHGIAFQIRRNRASIPRQKKGHYIHGFIPTVYLLAYGDNKRLDHVMSLEMKKLELLTCGELKIIHRNQAQLVTYLDHENTSESETSDANSNILFDHYNIPSTEWPAVIAVVDARQISFQLFKSELYLAISRARVYCSIVIQHDPHDALRVNLVTSLLDKLKPYVKLL